jgi:hypothetical protein
MFPHTRGYDDETNEYFYNIKAGIIYPTKN